MDGKKKVAAIAVSVSLWVGSFLGVGVLGGCAKEQPNNEADDNKKITYEDRYKEDMNQLIASDLAVERSVVKMAEELVSQDFKLACANEVFAVLDLYGLEAEQNGTEEQKALVLDTKKSATLLALESGAEKLLNNDFVYAETKEDITYKHDSEESGVYGRTDAALVNLVTQRTFNQGDFKDCEALGTITGAEVQSNGIETDAETDVSREEYYDTQISNLLKQAEEFVSKATEIDYADGTITTTIREDNATSQYSLTFKNETFIGQSTSVEDESKSEEMSIVYTPIQEQEFVSRFQEFYNLYNSISKDKGQEQ